MNKVLTLEAHMLVNGLDIQHSSEWEDYLEMNAQIHGLTREEYASYYLNTQWAMQCMESIVDLYEGKKVTRKQLDKALGEITTITQDLKATVLLWKDAKENGNGAKEAEHLDTLKKLNVDKKAAERKVEDFIKSLDKDVELNISEAKRGDIHRAAKKGNYPVTIVATRDGKVVRQETVNTPMQVPAAFNVIQFEERGQGGDVKVHIESRTGETLFVESEELNEGVFTIAGGVVLGILGSIFAYKGLRAAKNIGGAIIDNSIHALTQYKRKLEDEKEFKNKIKPVADRFANDTKLAAMYDELPPYINSWSDKATKNNRKRRKAMNDIAKYIKSKLSEDEEWYFKEISQLLRTGKATIGGRNTFEEVTESYMIESPKIFKYEPTELTEELRKEAIENFGNRAGSARVARPDLAGPIRKEIMDFFGNNPFDDVADLDWKVSSFDPSQPLELVDLSTGGSKIIQYVTTRIASQYGSLAVEWGLEIKPNFRIEFSSHSVGNSRRAYVKGPKFQKFLKELYLSIPDNAEEDGSNIMNRKGNQRDGIIWELKSTIPSTFLEGLMSDPITAWWYDYLDHGDHGTSSGAEIRDLFNKINKKYYKEWQKIHRTGLTGVARNIKAWWTGAREHEELMGGEPLFEATEVTKEMWDKEWNIKKAFGKEFDEKFKKRIEAAMSKAKNEEQAEEWAYKNFKQLPNPAKGMTIEESVVNEAKGAPWPEQLEKGLTHWGYKKGTHTRELKTLSCRIGRNADDYGGPNHAQEVADLNMKDPMVKKFFKPKFKVRPDGNYVNDHVELIPKKGYLYSLHVGTGQFEYFCLAIKPGEVYIFRKFDQAYGQYEYFQHEEDMSTRSGIFDFKRHREEEQWKWNKLKPDSASHFVSVGWGIMDIGIEYTQLEFQFENLKTFESFQLNEKAPFEYNLGYKGQRGEKPYWKYAEVIGNAVKDIEGIRDYHKQQARGGRTAVQDISSRILIGTYGQPDIKDDIIRALKGIDPNLDLKTIKNNYDASDSSRSKHDQDKDKWQWEIQKKEDFHSWERKYGGKPKKDT